MKRQTTWSVIAIAALILALIGCSKDEPAPLAPVASDQQQQKVETSLPSYWQESDLYHGEPVEPYVKSYAALTKSQVKRAANGGEVILMGEGFENGFAGWTTTVSGTYGAPGGFKVVTGGVTEYHPEWGWYVGHKDPYTAYYPSFLSHNEDLEHTGTGSNGASALENYPTYHKLYRDDVTLPPIGDLRLDFYIRWKNSTPSSPSSPASHVWSYPSQDIVVTLRDPATDAVLKTLFQASALVLPKFSGVGGSMAEAYYVLESCVIRNSQNPFPSGTYRLEFEINGVAYPLLVDLDDIQIVVITALTVNAPPAVTGYTGPNATECGVLVSDATLGTATSSPPGATISRSGGPLDNFFPVGTTTITYTATDAQGNTAVATQIVTVVDNTPPTITAPPAVTGYTGPSAATCETTVNDLGTATASDNCPGVAVSRVPAGNLFPVGTTAVTYTATDAHGNTATATQTVTVIDNTPPTITAPAAVIAYTGPSATTCGAVVTDAILGATANDNCPGVAVSRVPTGNFFPVGTTEVKYTATDAYGNAATATQMVTVVDNTPPTILSCSVSTPLLWPPNHKFVNVGLRVNVTDACDANPKVSIKVYSDEDSDKEKGDDNGKDDSKDKGKDKDKDKGRGDDKDSPDAKDIGSGTLQLRAERSGKGDGRVYLIVVTATDMSGNTSFSSCTVVVPHSESKKAIADVNAQAAAAKASCGPNGSPLTPYLIGSNQ